MLLIWDCFLNLSTIRWITPQNQRPAYWVDLCDILADQPSVAVSMTENPGDAGQLEPATKSTELPTANGKPLTAKPLTANAVTIE
jgi:hypothetical protein